MSASEKDVNNKVLTGMEPYRDGYQLLLETEYKSEKYEVGQSMVYEELERDIDVDRMDQFHVLQMIQNGGSEQSFEYLKEQVLEQDE